MTLEFRVNPSILDDFDHVCNQKPTAVSASKHGPKSISGMYNLIGGFEWNCCCVHSNQKENFTSQFSQRRMILTGQYVKGQGLFPRNQFERTRPGKRLHNYGKSPFFMGKLTIHGNFQ